MLKITVLRLRDLRVLLLMMLAIGLLGASESSATPVSVSVRTTDGISDQNVEDAVDEDEDASQDRSDRCEIRPFCDFPDGDRVYVNPGQDSVTIPFKADALCPETRSFTLFFFIDDYLIFLFPYLDKDQPRCFDFTLDGLGDLEPGDSFDFTIKVLDNRALTYTHCTTTIEVHCNEPPACYYNGGLVAQRTEMPIYDAVVGEALPVMEFCAESRCGNRARVEMFSRPPFMEPIGHRKGGMGEKVCIETKANDVVEGGFAPGIYWAKFRCVDLGSGEESVFEVGYRYFPPVDDGSCDDPPVCEIAGDGPLTVLAGESGTFTICGSSPCDDCDVAIGEVSLPGFVTFVPVDEAAGLGDDVESCAVYSVDPVAGDEGEHIAIFSVTDCNGVSSECSIDISVPAPLLACAENEDQLPNDSYDDASVVDAGDCVDGFGVNLYGVLDAPVFMNGDVDFFRVVGLLPGATYEATIVAGMNSENAFTDTMLGWLTDVDVIVATDDNSGPLRGYSKLAFVADGDGVATLAITGHGDDDFNGSMDGSMSYEEYGFGGYMLSIRVEEVDEMPIERQADLNGDGVVNTADLGMLIGVFGNPVE